MNPAPDGRSLVTAAALLGFLAVAIRQVWGLLLALSRRPQGPERKAILEELVWIGVAVGTVLALSAWAWHPGGG